MLKFFGLTELIGDSNTGKTSISLEESKNYKTLYIISTNFPIKRLEEKTDMYIHFIQNFDDLFLALRKINSSIELIVIDNLSSLIYLENYSYKKIMNLVLYLKKLISKYNTKILLVNNCNSHIEKANVYFSYKFGLEYEYQINTRYYAYKNGKEIFIKILKAPVELKFQYKIIVNRKSVVFKELVS